MSEPVFIESPRSYAHVSTAVQWKELTNLAMPLALEMLLKRDEVIMGTSEITGTDYFLSWGITWDQQHQNKKKVTIEVTDGTTQINSTSSVPVIIAQVDSGGGVMVDDYDSPTSSDSNISPYIDSHRYGELPGSLRAAFLLAVAIETATDLIQTLIVDGNNRVITIE